MRNLNTKIWCHQTLRPRGTDLSDIKQIDDWCNSFIGKRFRDWYSYGRADGVVYAFTNEDSLLVFKIKWG